MFLRLCGAVLAMAVATATLGCGYALVGRGNSLPAYIRTIGVPAFVNQSQTPDIDAVITKAVLAEFQSRGKYLVQPDSTGVDAVLTGTVRNVALPPASFTSDLQASRIVIVATLDVEFRDLRDNKVIWSNASLQARDEYSIAGSKPTDAATLFRQDAPALERLAKECAKTIVTEIFQAF